jgi:hypothetical protein
VNNQVVAAAFFNCLLYLAKLIVFLMPFNHLVGEPFKFLIAPRSAGITGKTKWIGDKQETLQLVNSSHLSSPPLILA